MQKYRKIKQETILKVVSFCAILPALFVGIYTMFFFHIQKNIWISNLIFVFIGILLSIIHFKIATNFKSNNSNIILTISIGLLVLTFLSEGIINVHRWISVLGIKLNIGVIVSPIFLIYLNKTTKINSAIFISMVVNTLYLLQPDASQVTAFSISAVIILLRKVKYKSTIILILITTFLFIASAWYNLDKLPAINYVEKIIQMANSINHFAMIIAIVSLTIIPLPFFIIGYRKEKSFATILGIYFSLTILSTQAGNFPVLIMGYGISPIIGYFIGLNFILKSYA